MPPIPKENPKEAIAIERIRQANSMCQRLYGCDIDFNYSGGKDSDVLAHLAMRAIGPEHLRVTYKMTTIDPPDAVWHARETLDAFAKDGARTRALYPEKNFFRLCVDGRKLPLRRFRFCCAELKEYKLDDSPFIATGVRWEESVQRRRRGSLETITSDKSERIVLNADNANERRMLEDCKLKAIRVINPIIDWTSGDIFAYAKRYGIQLATCYQYLDRVGCIGCPLANRKSHEIQFSIYPAMKQAWDQTIESIAELRKEEGKKVIWETPAQYWGCVHGVKDWKNAR